MTEQPPTPQVAPQPTSPSEQLRLLEPPVPVALRLDARTRHVGLAGVAHAKVLLAEQARRRAEREAAGAEDRRHPPPPPSVAA